MAHTDTMTQTEKFCYIYGLEVAATAGKNQEARAELLRIAATMPLQETDRYSSWREDLMHPPVR
jgi:predicted acetyltransferase